MEDYYKILNLNQKDSATKLYKKALKINKRNKKLYNNKEKAWIKEAKKLSKEIKKEQDRKNQLEYEYEQRKNQVTKELHDLDYIVGVTYNACTKHFISQESKLVYDRKLYNQHILEQSNEKSNLISRERRKIKSIS